MHQAGITLKIIPQVNFPVYDLLQVINTGFKIIITKIKRCYFVVEN